MNYLILNFKMHKLKSNVKVLQVIQNIFIGIFRYFCKTTQHMKITILCTGKTNESHIEEGVKIYEKRLKHYISYENIVIPDIKAPKSLNSDQVKKIEEPLQLKYLGMADYTVLLDERGKKMSSAEFAKFLEQRMNAGTRNLVFAIGGPYGFTDTIKQKANLILSFSEMTLSHQLIRLVFAEQLYRAFTIIRKEPYHH